MNNALTFIGGLGVGAGLGYMLDPARGRRRRKLAADQLVSTAHDAAEAAEVTQRDVENRARGLRARVRSRLRSEEVSDPVLVERIRSKMGRVVSHPRAIHVTSEGGVVTLSGPILRSDVRALLAAVRRVPGVKRIEDQLAVHDRAGDVPELQGVGHRPGRRPDVLQQNWSPATRALVGAGSLGLVGVGAARRGVTGTAMSVAGLGLLARAATNLETKRLIGLGAGRRAVDFQKAIHVHAPIDDVYRFWENFENFPRFMEHVRDVRVLGDGRSHWTIAGPLGAEVRFDAEVTKAVENKVLAWKTVGRPAVRHAGIVQFEEDPTGGTRLQIRMSYNPVLGAAGHTVASLFRTDPKHAMDEDLVRFKSLIEEGKTTAHGSEVSRERLESEMNAGRPSYYRGAGGASGESGIAPEGSLLAPEADLENRKGTSER
jgi:uncharacterized membrane protein